MEIKLAEEKDIPRILKIIKQRCDWFEENNIEQWGSWYYEKLYDEKYFLEAMKKYSLYIVKNQKEIIGAFLLKYENEKYWKDKRKSSLFGTFCYQSWKQRSWRNNIKFYSRVDKRKRVKIFEA